MGSSLVSTQTALQLDRSPLICWGASSIGTEYLGMMQARHLRRQFILFPNVLGRAIEIKGSPSKLTMDDTNKNLANLGQ